MAVNPLYVLEKLTILTFKVPVIPIVSDLNLSMEVLTEDLTYEFYLKGSEWKPALSDDVFFEGSYMILKGRCLNPLLLDNRILPGAKTQGNFQGIDGLFTRVAGDKGLPVVSYVIGDKVQFRFDIDTRKVDSMR